MPYDQQRYNSLISRCAFDMSAYTGSFQDRSPAQRTMTAVGAPTWTRVNGLPCLRSPEGTGITSGNVSAPVSMTASCAFEFVLRPDVAASFIGILRHNVAAGGWLVAWNIAGTQLLTLWGYNAGGATATSLTSSAAVARGRTIHGVISVQGGVPNALWINGIPGASAVVVGAHVDGGLLPVVAARAYGGAVSTMLIRAYPFALTNEEVQTLYQAAHVLTGGEV